MSTRRDSLLTINSAMTQLMRRIRRVDEARGVAIVVAVFKGTQTGEGGPAPATGKTIAADYVYSLEFDGDKIRHMTKIWNDAHSLKQLGWA